MCDVNFDCVGFEFAEYEDGNVNVKALLAMNKAVVSHDLARKIAAAPAAVRLLKKCRQLIHDHVNDDGGLLVEVDSLLGDL